MSGRTVNLTVPLSGEDAFQVTLLATCQASILAMQQRLHKAPNKQIREKREYWLERLHRDIEAINATFDGYVTKEFENKFKKYQKWVEVDMNSLLKDFVHT